MKQILIKPVVTEKTAQGILLKKFTFLVEENSNKIEIKAEIESIYGVNIKTVNISRLPSKKRARGRIVGHTKPKKKAIVTLSDEKNIEKLKELF
jgi:large subunit ribosomal protein L23